jgi:hypothetical protein
VKTLFFVLFLLTHPAGANQCLNLFQDEPYYEHYDHDYTIVIDPKNEDLERISPYIFDLSLLDEKIDPGDKVYIEFVFPLDMRHPTTTKGTVGYLIGTSLLYNEAGHLNLHYYIFTKTRGHLISFTKAMIDFEDSRLIKKHYGKTLH